MGSEPDDGGDHDAAESTEPRRTQRASSVLRNGAALRRERLPPPLGRPRYGAPMAHDSRRLQERRDA